MPSTGDVLITAGVGHEGLARELAAALSGRGLNVHTAEDRALPTEPVDVIVCFVDSGRSDLASKLGDALHEDLAKAVVVVSPAPLEGGPPEDAAVLRADPAWGPEALARLTEAALEIAREREGRKSAERRLAEIARVRESLDESLGAIVSHDLRTPVTTLRLLKDLLASHLSARADVLTKNERVSTDELLGIMGRSLDRMDAFIEDMLAAWRVSPGVPEDAAGPVDLNGVVEDIVAGLFPVAMQKDIVLDLATDPGAGLVLADSRRAGQVVSNLVGNALKFTPRGGSVTVSTRPAVPDDWADEDRADEDRAGEDGKGAVLEVADTGPGIADEDRAKVFERFGLGKARATGGEPSTGLGLYICREIVELYGGRIWFESAPGKGARFFVFLPGHSED